MAQDKIKMHGTLSTTIGENERYVRKIERNYYQIYLEGNALKRSAPKVFHLASWGGLFYYSGARSCQNATAAAAATLSESMPCDIGIRTT